MNTLQAYDRSHLEERHALIGVDEAGRGCLAGPVVAGACVLHKTFFASASALARSALINDSKQLSAKGRADQFSVLEELRSEGRLDFAVARGSVAEIAEFNILGATRLAMQRAIEVLAGRAGDWSLPHAAAEEPLFQAVGRVGILVDGRPLKPFPYAHTGLVQGDGRSLCIAMASIAAKVSRDRAMHRYAETYRQYGFEKHKGYGTAAHRAALREHGPCPIHRELFLRKLLLP
jgi:ribonuclease HII